jgi:DNA-directed RNA polymerase subunit beta
MFVNKKNERISFSSTQTRFDYPDFLEVQVKSFKEFFQLKTTPDNRRDEGLHKVFHENFPITDTRNNFVLEFIDYQVDPPRYSTDECIERGLTFSVPLKGETEIVLYRSRT